MNKTAEYLPLLPPLVPRSVLFGNPDRVGPKIAPDGKTLAYIAPRDGVLNVFVRTVGKEDDRPITHETVRPVRMFHWAENSRQILYPQDVGGDENFHLHLVDVATGDTRDITPFPGARASLVALEPEHPEAALVAVNDRDARCFDVYRCDLTTGELTRIAENPGNVASWEADHDLNVRGAVATLPDGGSELWVRDKPDGAWRTLVTFPFGEEGGPVAFTPDGSGLYLLSNKEVNTSRLYEAPLAGGAFKLVHAREDVDVSGLLFHPSRQTPEAVGYKRNRMDWVALVPEITADLKVLRTVDDGDLTEVSRSRDDRTWVVGYVRDNGPVRYYLYDREMKATTYLFSNRPAIEDLTLARMTPVDITARDGLVLPSYLTLPPNVPPKGLPLVLDVHGGPWARDHWGLNMDVQWLANRGYAVLQVNYRGSSGFGKAHLNAGNRE
jgi:dipeptidyl aminopeptidase/acylaminoacyl peptidase